MKGRLQNNADLKQNQRALYTEIDVIFREIKSL